MGAMEGVSGRGGAIRRGAPLPWIDWIRFLAAVQVFLFHLPLYVFRPLATFAAAHQPPVLVAWFALTNFGREAVIVFFALSGYLVGGSLIERVRDGSFQPAAYAIDRTVRVMLPFVPALAMSLALQAIDREPVDDVRTLGNLVALQGILVKPDPYLGVDWSLAYEIWFYVLGGSLAAYWVMPHRRGVALGIAALSFLALSILDQHHLLFCWILGALISQFPLRRGHWGAIFAGASLCMAGLFLTNSVFGKLRAAWFHLGGVNDALCDLVIATGALMIVRNVVQMPGRTPFTQRIDAIGTRLASFSYSLYLIHIPVLVLLLLAFSASPGTTTGGLLRYCAYVAAVLIAACGYYCLFERHTDGVRRWLKRRFGVA